MKTASLDEKDGRILGLLSEDASLTRKQIARKLGLPLTTVHNRIEKLKREGVIKRLKAEIDGKKIGRGLTALVNVSFNYVSRDFSQETAAKKMLAMPEVEEALIVAGETDVVLKIRVRDTDALNDFVIKKLRAFEGVDKTHTLVVMKEFVK
ncbi:MAG: Lrp/AsnC family transcriptional regulator [Candidatus Micrarchaeota archaeon]